MGLGAALLITLGKPTGLIFLAMTIYAICLLVIASEKFLLTNLKHEYASLLSTAILRPFAIVLTTVLIFDALGFQYLWYLAFDASSSNSNDVSKLTLGRIFVSIVIFYLTLVTSDFCKKMLKFIAKKDTRNLGVILNCSVSIIPIFLYICSICDYIDMAWSPLNSVDSD